MKARLLRPISGLLIALLLFSISGCASKEPAAATAASQAPAAQAPAAEPEAAKELFTLRVVDPPYDYLEFVTAWELGFFEDAGINIEFIGELSQGITNYQAIEQGIIDASYSGHPSNVAQARAAGLKVTMIAPGMLDTPESPHVTYLVQNDSKLQTLADLHGGVKVGIGGIGSCTSGYVEYVALQNGYPKDDVEFITFSTGGGTMEQALLQGDIDVTTSHTPYAEITLKTGEVRAIGNTYDIFNSGAGGLGARVLADRIIEEHPEVAQGFVDAMYRSRLWTNDHFEEAGDLVAAVLGLNKGDVLAIYQDTNKNVDPSYLDIWFDLAVQTGILEEGVITKEEIFTNKFVPKDAPASDKELHWDGVANRVFHVS
ncbi:MAG: ABC transporter substrate-binding protein [Clostridiales bacterium]|jgi:ABC-type nitrate/sulfonate/bicarbonate transport system substrate-binding protein|nr:ABC transporter substrate-binding protein [Clostridiales bacterium]MDR2749277.1 ABC transporter substrate-binding protein [Clostridiales bacterium]